MARGLWNPRLFFCIQLKRVEHPVGDEIIDLLWVGKRDPVGDLVVFGETACVDEACGEFSVALLEGQAEVDPLERGGFDLGKHPVAIEGNDGLAGAQFQLGSERQGKTDQFVVNRAKVRFGSGVECFDVARAIFQLGLRIGVVAPSAQGNIGDHPGHHLA